MFLHSYSYIYLHVHKKILNEKKNVYTLLIKKKTPSYAGLGSKQKTFSNCQAIYQKELCLLFRNQAIFFTK